MLKIKRALVGRCAGILGIVAVLLLWLGLMLPSHLVPRVGLGEGLSLMSGGVVGTVVASILDSKCWLLAVAVAVVTFILFYVAASA
jgi:hypothetical protein